MKRILIGLLLVIGAIALIVPKAEAVNGFTYTVVVDTYSVAGSTKAGEGDWPNIAGNGKIDKVILTNGRNSSDCKFLSWR